MAIVHGFFIGLALFFGSLYTGTLGLLHIPQNTATTTQQIATTTTEVQTMQPVSQSNATTTNPYIAYSAPIYVNQTYGFQIGMPSSWIKYDVRVQTDAQNITTVTFALPLQSNILNSYLTEPEASAHVIDRDNLEIIPIAAFEATQRDCDNADGPCSVPIEITRNSTYVFSWLPPDPHAGWDFCKTANGMEPYLCSVVNDEYYPNDGKFYFQENFKLVSPN